MPPTSAYLRILGPPLVEDGSGTPIDLPVGKPLALLIYLAEEGRPISRDDAARLLWPASTPDRARGSLRHALWLLRNRVSPELFRSDDPLTLDPELLLSDAHRFRSLLEGGHLDDAAALWRGRPFNGLEISDAPEWERWVDRRRLQWEDRFAEALSDEARRDRAAGRQDAELHHLRRAIQVQPDRLRRYMELTEALLDRREFEEAGELLAEARARFEGMEDLESILLLEEQIRTLRRGQAGDSGENTPLRLEFVGRSEEFTALVRRWRQGKAGAAAVGLIVGEEGIGRSRLAEEVALLAQTEGGRVVHVRAEDSERPFRWGLLGELVSRLLALSGASGISPASDRILRSFVPSLTVGDPTPSPMGSVSGVEPEGSRAALPSAPLVDALQDLVKAVSEDSPLVVIVDDLHWADGESRAVLARLATGLRNASVLLLITCDSDPEDTGIQKTLALIADAPGATRVHLRRWTREEVAEALGWMARFSRPVEAERLIDRIHLASRGFPLFVLELLKVFRREGILEIPERGGWIFRVERLQGVLPFPERLEALVDRELERLSAPAMAILRELAVAPSAQTLEEVGRRVGFSGRTVAEAGRELDARRLILRKDGSRLTIPHEGLRVVILRHTRHDGPPSQLPVRGRRRRLIPLAAVVALLTVAGSIHLLGNAGAGTPTPVVGGGSIFLHHSTGISEVRASATRPHLWEEAPSSRWIPLSGKVVGPFRTTDGALHWFENRRTYSELPWIVDLGTDGTERIPVRSNRDEELRALSPDGRFILFAAEDRQTSSYRQDLWIAERDGSAPRVLFAAADLVLGGSWSADGRRVVFAAQGDAADTLLVLTPDGSELARRTLPRFLFADWCGAGEVVVTHGEREEGVGAALWSPESGSWRPLPLPGVPGGPVACAPDGSAAAFLVSLDGEPDILVFDLASGDTTPMRLAVGGELHSLLWVPDRLDPVPVGVQILGERPIRTDWGGRVQLEAEVLYSDGMGRLTPVGWVSQNPEVASVNPEGILTANRAGMTKVFAHFDGWLLDSVPLLVRGDAPLGTLLREEFALLDLGTWLPVGDPIPIPDEFRGAPVLRLRGDGRGWDGLVSQAPVSLPQGGTLEAEFLLYLTEPHGQEVRLCLLDADPPEGTAPTGDSHRSFDRWTIRQEVCFRYPAGRVSRSNPSRAEIWSHNGFAPETVEVGRHLPRMGWFHVAITLRPDGSSQFFVNREGIGTTSPRVRMDGSTEWRIGIFGADLEGEVLARGLTLWPGVRY